MRHAWEHFSFCPRCGRGYGDNALAQPPTVLRCEGCGYDFYQHSSVAATAVIPAPDGRVLLLTRGNDPGKGRLALPGGFLDYDERPEAGVLREVGEEINHRVELDCLLDTYIVAYQYRDALVSVVELVFLTKPLERSLGTVRNTEVTGIDFYDSFVILNESERLAFPEQAQSLRSYRRHAF
jgi:ADP-ribose pyrophosphatase YjhB (NUDIX family)